MHGGRARQARSSSAAGNVTSRAPVRRAGPRRAGPGGRRSAGWARPRPAARGSATFSRHWPRRRSRRRTPATRASPP